MVYEIFRHENLNRMNTLYGTFSSLSIVFALVELNDPIQYSDYSTRKCLARRKKRRRAERIALYIGTSSSVVLGAIKKAKVEHRNKMAL